MITNFADYQDVDRHLKDLLRDTARSDYLFKEHNQIFADFSRQRMTKETVHKLLKLAEKAKLKEKIEGMFTGEHINVTEDRPVLHVALRAPREQVRNWNLRSWILSGFQGLFMQRIQVQMLMTLRQLTQLSVSLPKDYRLLEIRHWQR